MNGRDLIVAMSFVNEKYVHEANVKYLKQSRLTALKYGSLAACFAIIIAAISLVYNPETPVSPVPTPPDLPPVVNSSNEPDNTPPSFFAVAMNNVYFNGTMQPVESSLWYDPELYDFVKWDTSDMLDYYKTSLIPAYIPEGLIASESNIATTIIADKQGIVVNDVVNQSYYDYDVPLDSNLYLGFTLSISKLGVINKCKYENSEVEVTIIKDTEVIFGYRTIQSATSEEQYDLYTAEFMLNGIEYQLKAYQIPSDDFIKIVVSVIIGDENIEISN